MSTFTNVAWDWADTKVHPAIRYPSKQVADVDDDEISYVIGMVDSFNPRFNTPKTVINSLNDHNQGMVSQPSEYYIDITTKPYGDGYTTLLACQNGDRYFDVILAPLEDYVSADDTKEVGQPDGAWGPGFEVFVGCKVTNLSERYNVGSNPTVTFNCRALRFAWGENDQRKEFGNGYAGRAMSASRLGLE